MVRSRCIYHKWLLRLEVAWNTPCLCPIPALPPSSNLEGTTLQPPLPAAPGWARVPKARCFPSSSTASHHAVSNFPSLSPALDWNSLRQGQCHLYYGNNTVISQKMSDHVHDCKVSQAWVQMLPLAFSSTRRRGICNC